MSSITRQKEKYHSLTSKEASQRLKEFGSNEIEQKGAGYFQKFVKWFISPISIMLFAAAALSMILGKAFDFYFIIFLALLNIFVGFWHEKKADSAIKKLQDSLAVQVKVERDGKWQKTDSRDIVPDDIIRLGIGDIIPADAKVLEAKNLSINESVLTGESLPSEKKEGDKCFAGSFVATGFAICRVTSTGKHTYFGKTLITVEKASKRSLLEKDILSISKYLAALSLAAVLILSIVFVLEQKPILELLELDLSLVIAGIPISLPTVMTLIISIGIVYLTKKKAITRKVASLENLANVNLLLTDKTGTLTRNEINLVRIIPKGKFKEKDVLEFAYLANYNAEGPIRDAILKEVKESGTDITNYQITDFTPYDSDRKRSTAQAELASGIQTISIGAPQIILKFCKLSAKQYKDELKEIEGLAENGYKSLLVSVRNGSGEKDMSLAGIILFSDILRSDSKEVLDFMHDQGIDTKLITGDNFAISKRISRELELPGNVWGKEQIAAMDFKTLKAKDFDKVSVFSEILPLEKFKIVEFAKKHYIVAVTGDGVNDIPPVEASDVGIAVKKAVDALKGAADIVA